MVDVVPMTQAGYNKKKAELEKFQDVDMPIILERLATARDEGDLKENAEYHGARESQGMLQARINMLKDVLGRARIMDPATMPKDEVAFGITVTVKDLDYDDEEEFTLVGLGEEDYNVGKILVTSPLAQGLLGKKIGEKVSIDVPKGKLNFEILGLRFDEE
jgi:transcription elongation factor GreA